MIHLKLGWIIEQSTVDKYVDSLLLKTDLSSIAEKYKLRYFLKMYDKLGSEALKNKCREHMFKEIDIAVKIPQKDHYVRYNYFKYSDETNKDSFLDCASYQNSEEQFLVLYSDEIQKDIPVISWRIQVLDFGEADDSAEDFAIGIHDAAAVNMYNGDEAIVRQCYTWSMNHQNLCSESENIEFRKCAGYSYGSDLRGTRESGFGKFWIVKPVIMHNKFRIYVK